MKKFIFVFILFFNTELCYADSSADTHLINEMLTTVNNQYLYDIENEKIVSDGLQALSDLDKDIVVSKGTDKIYIYYRQKIAKIIPLPQDKSSIPQWVETVARTFDGAAEISETVSTKDFELPDIFMKKICENLDKNSRYYSEYDYEEEDNGNLIYTLYSSRKIDNTLLINIRVFNKQTAKAVAASLNEKKPYDNVIIDLRGNSGGMLNEALKVAGFFTDGIIAYTAGRNNTNKHYYTSDSEIMFDGPLVVLTDKDTASAAEVLAGGLQAQSRAKIIGTTTYGKGTIQNITQMSNGGRLALTSEQFFTPSDRAINGQGITPDYCQSEIIQGKCVKESRLKQDEDIDKARRILQNM